MKLKYGDAAPTFEAEDANGHIWQIPDDFKNKPFILVFLRHLGCPLCMRRLDELKAEYSRFKGMGAELMVITQSTQERVRKYSAKKSIPYPLIGDKEKKIYSLFGVRSGGLGALLAPRVLKESAKATLKGYFHGPLEGDELLVPAEFIIGGDGKIAWAHYGSDISDSSPNEIILKELRALK